MRARRARSEPEDGKHVALTRNRSAETIYRDVTRTVIVLEKKKMDAGLAFTLDTFVLSTSSWYYICTYVRSVIMIHGSIREKYTLQSAFNENTYIGNAFEDERYGVAFKYVPPQLRSWASSPRRLTLPPSIKTLVVLHVRYSSGAYTTLNPYHTFIVYTHKYAQNYSLRWH